MDRTYSLPPFWDFGWRWTSGRCVVAHVCLESAKSDRNAKEDEDKRLSVMELGRRSWSWGPGHVFYMEGRGAPAAHDPNVK